MESVQAIYDSLWEKSFEKFKNNKFEFDYYLNHREEDKRRGLTIIGRLQSEIVIRILDFLNECKLVEPNQYYYDGEDMHITILSIITCLNEFNIENINKEKYVDIIKESIKVDGPLQISFKGITASPSCIMIQGFPMDNKLNSLRQQLRDNFKNSPLENSIDQRYILKTAHSTVIRFKNPITNKNLFVDCLNKYRNYNFGVSEIDSIEFNYIDAYMTNALTSKIKNFDL